MTSQTIPGCPAVETEITIATDGRKGVPNVVVYRIETGPQAGEISLVPPRVRTHPAGKDARTSVSYSPVIKNPELYETLRRSGWLNGQEHFGPVDDVIDNRTNKGA